jgi:predicted nucleic acid-binding protein
MELLERHPVTGGDVFDLQLAATMKANNVQRIYTFNAEDFEVFPELTVVVPHA